MRKLVNLLLIVMIAGILSVTIALMLKLKDMRAPVHPLAPGERVVSATATPEGISLVIEGPEGKNRIVLLDGTNFQPVREILTPTAE